MMAPSAVNKRPWAFVVVRDRAVIDTIRELHPYAAMLETASLAIVVVGLLNNPPERFNKEFFPQDCGAATQNILLQAASMGLGTCWCAVFPNEDRVSQFKELLDISEGVPYCVIAVGVPDEQPEARGFYEAEKVTYI